MIKPEENYIDGIVFDIQHFSIHDGPGIRTTVFFKGCPLKCKWCHNPESITIKPILSFNSIKCIGCGRCYVACPNNVHTKQDGQHIINRSKCEACGFCVSECPSDALELSGRKMSSMDVIREVLKDKMFYEDSGGGITLSGGEPMIQFEFAFEILTMAKKNNLNTAIETCGYCKFEDLKKISKVTDLFLYDYKLTDDVLHTAFTGRSNNLILDNLKKLNDLGSDILLRCPIIAGVNDSDQHFKAIAEITQQYDNVIGAELLPYHRLGVSKIGRFGLDSDYFGDYGTSSDEIKNGWIKKVIDYGGILVNDI